MFNLNFVMFILYALIVFTGAYWYSITLNVLWAIFSLIGVVCLAIDNDVKEYICWLYNGLVG